jgi:hypothetical protein
VTGVVGSAGAEWAWVAPGGSDDNDVDSVDAPAEPADGHAAPRADRPASWRGVGLAGSRRWIERPPPREPPPLPARLTPLTLSDLLDGAWAVLSCRPGTVLALSALIVVPAELLASFMIRGQGRALDTPTMVLALFPFVRSERGFTTYDAVETLAAVAVLSFAYTLLGGAIGRLVGAWYEETDLTLRQVLGATGRRLPALGVAWVLTSVLQVLSLYLGLVGALFVFPLLLVVAPVITIERRGPLAALARSSRLVTRRFGAVMGVWIVAVVIERIITSVLGKGPDLLASLVPDPAATVMRSAGWAFALFVTAPTVAGYAALQYIDLRVRTEGLDLEVDAAGAFGADGTADGR